MNKLLSILFAFLLFVNMAKSQEELVPLDFNSNISLRPKMIEKVGGIHETYIYLFDTLNFPFIDDFSQNHFPSFDAEASDPNVISQTWYRIEIGGIAEPMGAACMLDTTFTYRYETVPGYGFDSIILVNKTAQPDQLAEIFNIDIYPVTSQVVKVWPDYNVYDSIWNMTSVGETIYIDFNDLDVYQDSATVYFVSETLADSNTYWQDIQAYHNYTYAENIQTLGVASFDGLDEFGYPYDFTSTTSYGVADVLTSKPIDMSGLNVGDSIYFSFVVQPGGLGENPDANDSLLLEFWSPLTAEWQTIWRTNGYSSSTFDMQLIKITNALYFQDGFQFRFKNYGGLSGSIDVWHIDYVNLDEQRSYDELLLEDWAYSEPSPSFIKSFTSMPWPHYEFSPESNMVTEHSAKTYNSSASSPLINPCAMNLLFDGNNINSIPYNNTSGSVPSQSFFEMDYTIPTNFWFDTILADTCADFNIVQYIDNNGLQLTELVANDTLRHTQHFSNYYAYDDGTAEAAYGLISNGAQLAYKFSLSPGLTDSIRAISMHFSPNTNDVSNALFFLQIWDDYLGEPGNIIYTTDQTIGETYTPEYNIGNNGFYEYVLPEKVAVSGTYYVGWKQSSNVRLNIGFDRNINNQDKIFYKTGTNWQNTINEGSLMMRPVFVSDKDFILSQKEIEWNPNVNVYPNPANNEINIFSEDAVFSNYGIYDMQGKLVASNSIFSNQEQIDVSSLTNGLYILTLRNEQNQSIQKKISIFR